MSNEPGGPAPVPDPYAAPEPTPSAAPDQAATTPLPIGGYAPVAPSGYEAVRPADQTQPIPPYGAAPPAASPYAAPAAGGQQPGGPGEAPPVYGTPAYGAPQYGGPQYGAPQYGAPQNGAPQYGAPEYGAPPAGGPPAGGPPYGAAPGYGGYGYAPAYAPPPTEGMAIASFVTSTAGLLFLGGLPGPVGLGLGIAALRRIKANGKSGRGWAIAGIAVGAVGILWLLAIIAYFVFIFWLMSGAGGSSSSFWDELEQGIEDGSGDTGSDDSYESDGTLPRFTLRTDLAAGTCLTTYAWDYDMADTDPVDCAVPHEAEVVGLIEMSGPVTMDTEDEYDSVYNDAWDACDQLTESLLPDYFSSGNIELYYPHPDDFAAGSTSAYCVYWADDAGVTGSVTAGTLELASLGTQS